MKNNEPTLESIEDYNTLKGSKKRVVWTVIISIIVVGIAFTVAKNYYGKVNDSILVEEAIGKVPVK